MNFIQPIAGLLGQLQNVVDQLSDERYTQPIPLLSGASIGQHTRHILEFFVELNKGYPSGTVDYDRRERDHRIETDRFVATSLMQVIIAGLGKPDKELLFLASDYKAEPSLVSTNYQRELIYNMEHAIHHMAIIRIGVITITDVPMPPEFGVAPSTLKFRSSCAR